MIRIPNNVQELRPYKPGKANNDVLKVNEGQHLSVLCSNENNFGPSPLAKKAIVEAMDDLYLYPDPTGIDLRIALAERLGIKSENILLGNGSDGILYTLFNAFFDEGQSILTSKNTFVSLHAMAQMNRIPMMTVPMKEGYQFDLDLIFASIHNHTKVIYLCNPNNPTGTVIPEEELVAFIKKVPDRILIVIDEAYCEFAESMDQNYANTLRWKFDNVVTLRTFSKAYGLAGVRLGYAIGAQAMIEALYKVKLTFNPNNLAQAAGLAALQDKAHLNLTIENNKEWMGKFIAAFKSKNLNYIPSYTNFIMLDLGSEKDAKSFNDYMAQNHVLVRQLTSFGLPHCVRISIGTPKDNALFLEVLSKMHSTV